MSITRVVRWSGLAALVAGICFAVVGLLHPLNEVASITTARWTIVHLLAIAMSVFGLFGVMGLYARQAEKAGWLGLAGTFLMSLWLLLVLPFTVIEVFVLPQLATAAPTVAEAFLGVFTKTAGPIDFSALATLWSLTDILFLIGGLVFGIATLRAGVLSRWAACLFTAGMALAPVFGLLPPAYRPLVAVPIGLGLAWLGFTLMAERRVPAGQPAGQPAAGPGSPRSMEQRPSQQSGNA